MQELELNENYNKLINRKLLCRTLANNRVELVTITNPKNNHIVNKKNVIISARVHPGETVSSFVLKGFIEFLLD